MSTINDVVNKTERGDSYNISFPITFDDDHTTYGVPQPRPPKK